LVWSQFAAGLIAPAPPRRKARRVSEIRPHVAIYDLKLTSSRGKRCSKARAAASSMTSPAAPAKATRCNSAR
jgi:hypothetical protein